MQLTFGFRTPHVSRILFSDNWIRRAVLVSLYGFGKILLYRRVAIDACSWSGCFFNVYPLWLLRCWLLRGNQTLSLGSSLFSHDYFSIPLLLLFSSCFYTSQFEGQSILEFRLARHANFLWIGIFLPNSQTHHLFKLRLRGRCYGFFQISRQDDSVATPHTRTTA